MSDSEEYEYEYDESDQEQMDADTAEEESFQYTDDEGESQPNEDDGEVALENAYYNAKGERDAGEMDEAKATFESVVRMETNQNKKAAGVDVDTAEDDMDVDEGRKFKALKYHGSWSYKAIKQLVKLHIRALDGKSVMKDYTRMLCVAGSPDAAISPNALEKGVNGMLDRVSNIMTNPPSDVASDSSAHTLARDVYDLTIEAFHPKTGVSPNERLWFKTNLKYGQLLYEMNETARLRSVIKDLLVASGQPADILDGSSSMDISSSDNSTSGTQLMEIAALQIQLYSKLKDTKSLRACYYKAMSVKNAVPHPRTIALIQEIGGKMHASRRNFDEACQAFFQAFKSYDEAGDRSRLRCLNYLVMASMLHASSINPFDSHEARAHRDDPQIAAMTNLVQAFHNDDIKKFEQILKKNEGGIFNDEFISEYVSDLLRTIRTQVIMRNIGPYTRIRLARIARDLNNIPIDDVENILVSLILDGKLDGSIDQVNGILVKKAQNTAGEKDGDTPVAANPQESVDSRNLNSLMKLTSALESLTVQVSKVGSKGAAFQQIM